MCWRRLRHGRFAPPAPEISADASISQNDILSMHVSAINNRLREFGDEKRLIAAVCVSHRIARDAE